MNMLMFFSPKHYNMSFSHFMGCCTLRGKTISLSDFTRKFKKCQISVLLFYGIKNYFTNLKITLLPFRRLHVRLFETIEMTFQI